MPKKIDQASIRIQNLCHLWSIIYDHPGITRQELADCSGLSPMSVTNLVNCLDANNALRIYKDAEDANTQKGAGRKAEHIAINEQQHMWVLVDLSDIYFRYNIFTLNMRSIAESAFTYAPAHSYMQNLLVFLAELRQNIQLLLPSRSLFGVVISTPGPYDSATDTVNNMRIPQVNKLHLAQLLNIELGSFNYHIDEDVKLAVRAYLSSETDSAALSYYLYIGEGVGGAACLGDTVLHGLNAVAGDAGQLTAHHNDTFESIISLRAFAHTLAPDVAEDLPAADLPTNMLMQTVFRYSKAHPHVYKEALSRIATYTARMLYDVIWILDPFRIIIDCPYASWAEADFMRGVRASITELVSDSLPRIPEIVFASDAVPAVCIGAMQVVTRAWIERLIHES